jgi:hypothetical protein
MLLRSIGYNLGRATDALRIPHGCAPKFHYLKFSSHTIFDLAKNDNRKCQRLSRFLGRVFHARQHPTRGQRDGATAQSRICPIRG